MWSPEERKIKKGFYKDDKSSETRKINIIKYNNKNTSTITKNWLYLTHISSNDFLHKFCNQQVSTTANKCYHAPKNCSHHQKYHCIGKLHLATIFISFSPLQTSMCSFPASLQALHHVGMFLDTQQSSFQKVLTMLLLQQMSLQVYH